MCLSACCGVQTILQNSNWLVKGKKPVLGSDMTERPKYSIRDWVGKNDY